MLLESLEKIGLSRKESLVYLELLNLGAQPVSVIARRIAVNRTTVYSVLQCLEKKGVVGSSLINSVRYFSAHDPNCLVDYMERRLRSMDYYRSQLTSLIPKLRANSLNPDIARPQLSYFDGILGMKNLLGVFFANEKALNCLWNPELWKDIGLEGFVLDQLQRRFLEKDTVDRVLILDTPYNLDFAANFLKEVNFRVTSRADLFNREMYILDDQLAFFSFDTDIPYGILIKSKPISRLQGCIFDELYSSIWENNFRNGKDRSKR